MQEKIYFVCSCFPHSPSGIGLLRQIVFLTFRAIRHLKLN